MTRILVAGPSWGNGPATGRGQLVPGSQAAADAFHKGGDVGGTGQLAVARRISRATGKLAAPHVGRRTNSPRTFCCLTDTDSGVGRRRGR
jgi:hypothetical protein